MSGGRRCGALAAVAAVLVSSGLAAAQRPAGPERAERVLEALLVWRLVDELELSDEQVCRVLPALRALKHARLAFGQRRAELHREIRALLRERPVDRERVEAKVRELQAAQREFQQRRGEALERIRAALTPEQRARFALIQDTFERETLSLLGDLERFVREGTGPPGRP